MILIFLKFGKLYFKKLIYLFIIYYLCQIQELNAKIWK